MKFKLNCGYLTLVDNNNNCLAYAREYDIFAYSIIIKKEYSKLTKKIENLFTNYLINLANENSKYIELSFIIK